MIRALFTTRTPAFILLYRPVKAVKNERTHTHNSTNIGLGLSRLLHIDEIYNAHEERTQEIGTGENG
jgi:hypothetical protein